MVVNSYLSIENPVSGIYKEKGSKFLAFAYPVKNEEEIKANLAFLKKEYHDARHHCFAWILGPEKNSVRAFDDGEPNHSAGDPILGQIRSKNLTNVLVVVVRYFGGVKLGVGGLISAYKEAAQDALQKAVIVEEEVMDLFCIKYPYDAIPEVMKMVKEYSLQIINQTFEAHGVMEVKGPVRMKQLFLERIRLLNNLNIPVELSPL
jgi:uncharacterized YigZ family protein